MTSAKYTVPCFATSMVVAVAGSSSAGAVASTMAVVSTTFTMAIAYTRATASTVAAGTAVILGFDNPFAVAATMADK